MRTAFGFRRRRSFCGGCGSACLLLVVSIAVLVYLFRTEVSSAIRGIYPAWPFVLAIPLLSYASSWQSQAHPGRPFLRDVRVYLASLLRASLPLPVGRHTFRLYLFCHGIPDRCLKVRGHALPICARCTGLLIGLAIGLGVPASAYLGPIVAIGLASLLAAPLLIDGFTQLAGLRQSTNRMRLSTGAIGGLGLAFAAQAIRFVLVGS